MEKLLEDIPATKKPSQYRQFLLALSLSPLSQEPPMENWEMYCRQQNDCCVVSTACECFLIDHHLTINDMFVNIYT